MNATLQVNGEPQTVPAGLSVPELLARLQVAPQSVLVEHNGAALFRRDWEATRLQTGDRLEIIRVVAGG